MTLLELIRLQLNEAEAEPGASSKLIGAVDALSDYVECQGALAQGDMRRWCWLGAYLAMFGNSHVYPSECRAQAKAAAYGAVADFDEFIASGQPARDEGDDA